MNCNQMEPFRGKKHTHTHTKADEIRVMQSHKSLAVSIPSCKPKYELRKNVGQVSEAHKHVLDLEVHTVVS